MVGILDYGMGNLRSVYNAVEYIGSEAKLILNTEDFKTCDHLIIPGVGSFYSAMNNLTERGIVDDLKTFINSGRPVLGICLGMQLLASVGFEPVETNGLDIIPGQVIKIEAPDERIPHVGWNSISLTRESPLFEGVKDSVDFYFVHSYYFDVKQSQDVLAYTDYGIRFPSIVQKENVTGIQFHPEKSQKNGLKILKNFCESNA